VDAAFRRDGRGEAGCKNRGNVSRRVKKKKRGGRRESRGRNRTDHQLHGTRRGKEKSQGAPA